MSSDLGTLSSQEPRLRGLLWVSMFLAGVCGGQTPSYRPLPLGGSMKLHALWSPLGGTVPGVGTSPNGSQEEV